MSVLIQTLIASTAGAGILALLAFVLYRQRETASTANTALDAVGKSVRLTSKMQTAMDMQQQRLDAWEDWGRSMKIVWDRLRIHMENEFKLDIGEMPEPPVTHLDLSSLFNED